MNLLTVLFLTALGVMLILRGWLARRQIAHVRAQRDRVPAPFSARIALDAHCKAADYTLVKTSFSLVESAVNAALLLGWTLGGGLSWLDRLWHASGLAPLAAGAGFMLSAVLIMALLELPLSAYHSFVLEQRFGFNRMTPGLFLTDAVKSGLLLLLLGAPLAWTALWLMQRPAGLWWLHVWAVWIAFSLLLSWAYPAFIAPLFNRFSPLQDHALRQRINKLLAKCGFTSKGVFVMDGSRRSSHGNAYFTGLGNNKRIVFFDTLVQALAPDEIEAVLAHELGHFRLHHVSKHMLALALTGLAGFALLGWLIDKPWFYSGLGVTRPSHAAALMLFMLVAPVFGFFLRPVVAYLSRRHEFQADAYAARHSDPAALIHALVKLYEENASTLTPDPVYSAFYDSHPPAPVRVARLSSKINLQYDRS